jgi:hypothetical protein
MLIPDGTEPRDRPVVVRVASRRRVEPALVVAVLVLTLVGVALWKPWVNGDRDADSAPPRATGLGAAVASDAPRPAAVAATPRQRGGAVTRALPALYGLDLAYMGTADPHAAWGIAVAYAPTGNIALAVAGRRPTITPVVDWEAQQGRAVPDPIMDHPRTVTIAVAVTWPHMPPPRAVRLVQTGMIASTGGAVTRLPAAQPIPLSEPLPLLVRLAVGPAPGIDWELISGTFYLPSEGPPTDVRGWLTGGWHPGAYAFVVTQSDGSTRSLSFVLRG